MEKYIKIYKWSYATDARRKLFRLVDYTSVAIVVLAYIFYIIYAWLAVGTDYATRAIVFSALPFGLFSMMRRQLAYPRPYEVIDFGALGIDNPSKKRGSSFPSRHVFSAFLIGTMMLIKLPIVAGVSLFFGALLAITRVVRGIHFIKDTVVGAIIGIISGAIALLLM